MTIIKENEMTPFYARLECLKRAWSASRKGLPYWVSYWIAQAESHGELNEKQKDIAVRLIVQSFDEVFKRQDRRKHEAENPNLRGA